MSVGTFVCMRRQLYLISPGLEPCMTTAGHSPARRACFYFYPLFDIYCRPVFASNVHIITATTIKLLFSAFVAARIRHSERNVNLNMAILEIICKIIHF